MAESVKITFLDGTSCVQKMTVVPAVGDVLQYADGRPCRVSERKFSYDDEDEDEYNIELTVCWIAGEKTDNNEVASNT